MGEGGKVHSSLWSNRRNNRWRCEHGWAVDLDDVMDKMLTGDDDYRYSVAWIDCQSTGSRLGRSVLTRGDHARADDLERRGDRTVHLLV